MGSGFHPMLVRLSRSMNEVVRTRCLAEARNLDKGVSLLFVMDGNNLEVFFAGPLTQHFEEQACLNIPGPFMESLRLSVIKEKQGRAIMSGVAAEPEPTPEQARTDEFEQFKGRYERLAGAIGKGKVEAGLDLMLKARKLKIMVVGAGRAGSWLAYRLAECGIGSEGGLVIVDPDVVEESNLPDMHVPAGAVGWPKAEAVAATIMAMVPGSHPVPFSNGLDTEEVVNELCTSDVVFTAVDEDSARLGVAILATRYHLLQIDVSGGCSWISRDVAEVGGELRIFVPGTLGCLGCMTKTNLRDAEHLLMANVQQERERRAQLDWRGMKAGSSADILFPVLGEAVQSFWAILSGELRHSVWWHYGKGRNGMPVWEDWSNKRSWRRCRICSHQAGLGDLVI
jgi:molybdopterin/thiamine biosynthesis adenylyltransferase